MSHGDEVMSQQWRTAREAFLTAACTTNQTNKQTNKKSQQTSIHREHARDGSSMTSRTQRKNRKFNQTQDNDDTK